MLDDPSFATYGPLPKSSAKPRRRANTGSPATALVVATTAATTAIAEAIRSNSSAPECKRWASASARLQALWPVEGGSAGDIANCTALLLSLGPLADAKNGIAEALARENEASAALAACLSAAASQPSIAAILSRLRPQVEQWLPQIAAEARQNATAVTPVAWLYENVLARFNRSQRAKRGVFHTPAAVVDWMVDAASALVQRHFSDSASAANTTAIRVIDAGCSCGTFLSAAAQCSTLQRFDRHLLGYEVLPAAWGLARWSLADTADICWCNPLLAGEAEAERILANNCLPVFIGNPPYANFGKQNRGPWIDALLADYKRGVAERKTNLTDDYLKFFRWSQHWVERAGRGIVAFVTSNTYLQGLTQRGVRASLLETFDELYFLNLHGSASDNQGQTARGADENLFSVRSGVAIALLVKTGRGVAKVARSCSIRGSRQEKAAWLASNRLETAAWKSIEPQAPNFIFAPTKTFARQKNSAAEYESFWPLTSIFKHYISGVQTKNDALLVDFDRDALAARIQVLLKATKYTANAKAPIAFDPGRVVPYLLAPFDRRWLYYEPKLVGRARESVLRHMLLPNIGLVFMRQSTGAGEYDHVLAVDCLASDRVFYSRHGAPYCAPLWLYAENVSEPPSANLQPAWIAALCKAIGRAPAADEAFDYVYAVLHRHDYRKTFVAELRVNFPRIALPKSHEAFVDHASVGHQLRELHTQPAPDVVPISAKQQAMAETISIGGYAVLRRWRKPRRQHDVTDDARSAEAHIAAQLFQTAELRQALSESPPLW